MTTFGTTGQASFYVNNNGTWTALNHYEYFKVKKKQNQISEFEVRIYDITNTEKAYLTEKAEVMFFVGTNLLLKGRIQNIDYEDSYGCTARGFGMEVKLLDSEFIYNGDNRVEFNNTSAQTIATALNNSILTTASSGLFSSDYGNVSLRFEYANRLNAIAKLADAIDYEWWVSHLNADDFATNYLNISSYQGSSSSVKTFNLSLNAVATSQERDLNNIVNYVTVLGYGDGINQLKNSTYAASTASSTLSADITSTASSIGLSDASSFSTTGSFRISEEILNYAGKSSNNLTGCTRGVSGSTADSHKKGVYAEQYFPYTSSQSASSISTYGLMDHTIVDKTIINSQTAELVASKYLIDRKSPIIRIKLTPDEPLTDALLGIGDKITINDAESNISGDYRIVALEFQDYYGDYSLELEVSNRNLNFIEQVNNAREEQENMAKYMQGATNIYSLSEAENCDFDHPLNMRVYIPTEAVAINKVSLNFKMKNYRVYEELDVYGIHESVLTDPGVRIDVGEEGSETFVNIYDTDQSNLDITNYLGPAGAWYNIKFIPLDLDYAEYNPDSTLIPLFSSTRTRIAQKKTIDGDVYSLSLYLYKTGFGSPTGNVYIKIIRASDDTVLDSYNLGDASAINTGYYTWNLSTPLTLISESVYLAAEWTGSVSGTELGLRVNNDSSHGVDIPGENMAYYTSGTWSDQSYDLAYKLIMGKDQLMRIEANAYVQIFLESR